MGVKSGYDFKLGSLWHFITKSELQNVRKCDSYLITKCSKTLLQNASVFLVQNVTVLYRMRELLQIKTILISNVTVLQNETLIIKGDTKLKALKDEKLYSPQSLINI